MSTEFNIAQVTRIADLARITIAEHELNKYGPPLLRIFELATQMNAINTTHVEPTAHPFAISQRLRPDQVNETDQQLPLQALAPQMQDGLYIIPRTIE